MKPIVIRSPGARAPPRPRTDAGSTMGAATAQAMAVELRCKKRRRVSEAELGFIFSYAYSQSAQELSWCFGQSSMVFRVNQSHPCFIFVARKAIDDCPKHQDSS